MQSKFCGTQKEGEKLTINLSLKITLLTNVLYHGANKHDLLNHFSLDDCMQQYNEQQQ